MLDVVALLDTGTDDTSTRFSMLSPLTLLDIEGRLGFSPCVSPLMVNDKYKEVVYEYELLCC
jgi:hypothetical protein